MSQALISASEKSVTLSKMVSMNKYVPFYQPSPAMDAGGILPTQVSPSIGIANGTAIADQTVTWTLPSAGLLVDASIGFICRVADVTGLAVTQPIAFNMVRQFQVISNGVPIINKTGVAIKAQAFTLRDAGYQTYLMRNATFLGDVNETPAVPADNATDWRTYLPCIETFLSAPEKALLLNKTKLEIAVTFNSNALSGVAGNITFTKSPVLYLYTHMPKLSVYNEIVTQDWSKQFTMDMINCYVEPVQLTSATRVTGYQITCPYPAIKTHFVVQRITPVADSAAGTGYGAATLKINTISLNIGGVKFFDEMKASRVMSNSAKYGTTRFTLADAPGAVDYDDSILTVDWGLTGSRAGSHGINFWAENQGSTVDLVFAKATSGAGAAVDADRLLYNLYIVHEYIQLVDWVPGSGGRGFLQVSSNN